MAEVKEFSFIDLFSGVGGMTLGFSGDTPDGACRFTPRLMVDKDPEAREVALRNFPRVRFHGADVHQLSGREIRHLAGLAPDETLHILLGGPPCQGFSYLGKRALEDERNALVLDYLRLVKELQPLVAVMENVPLIMSAHGGSFINDICESLSMAGYSSAADIVVASDYGVPQLRKRAIIIAYRRELGLIPSFPPRTHERVTAAALTNANGRVSFEAGKTPYISVDDAIGDLPVLQAGEGDDVTFYTNDPYTQYQQWARDGSVAIFNHKSRAHTGQYLKKISIIKEGSRNAELPDGARFSDNYFSQAYARLSRNGIAQTVTTCFGNPGSGRFLHYRELRSITVREAARLQSFPDSFVFEGTLAAQMRHVGNAVPPLLARALRNSIAQDFLQTNADKLGTIVGRPKAPRQETPEQRSRVMRQVPSKNTSIELVFRKALWAAGLRGFRLHDASIPGHPDVVFSRRKVVVFVDGCFWHGCPKCYREPNTNQEYWTMKVERNRNRDAKVTTLCEQKGWTVMRFWEHEIAKNPERVIRRLVSTFNSLDRKSLRRKRMPNVAQ